MIPDDARDLCSHVVKVAPDVLKKNPSLDLQGESLRPGTNSQIPSKEGSDDSGCKSSDIIIIIIRIFTHDNPSVHCTAINGVLHIELN